jgi:TP901 family phage tail tape measure protein
MPVHAEDLLVRLKVVEETAAIRRMKDQLTALGVEGKKTGQTFERDLTTPVRNWGRVAQQSGQAATNAMNMAGVAMARHGSELAGLVTRYASWAVAIETARRSVLGFAQLDTQLRRIAIDAGAPVEQLKRLKPELQALAATLGVSTESLVTGFNTLREYGNLSVEQTRKVFPEVARGAKALGVSADELAKTQATIMANFNLGASSIAKTNDMLMRASKDYKLDLKETLPLLGMLAEESEHIGLTQERGLATTLALIGARKQEGVSSQQAAQQVLRFYSIMASPQVSEALTGNKESLRLMFEEAKRRGTDGVAHFMHLAIEAENRLGGSFVENLFGKGPRGAAAVYRNVKQVLNSVGTDIDRLEKSSEDVADALKTLFEGPEHSIDVLITELGNLKDSFGELLIELGAIEGVKALTGYVRQLKSDIEEIVRVWKQVTGQKPPEAKAGKGIPRTEEGWLDFLLGPLGGGGVTGAIRGQPGRFGPWPEGGRVPTGPESLSPEEQEAIDRLREQRGVPAPPMQQRFGGMGGGAIQAPAAGTRSPWDVLSGGYSENVEDRRKLDENTGAVDDLTAEIRDLKDQLGLGAVGFAAGGGAYPSVTQQAPPMGTRTAPGTTTTAPPSTTPPPSVDDTASYPVYPGGGRVPGAAPLEGSGGVVRPVLPGGGQLPQNHNDLNRAAYARMFKGSPLANYYDSVVAAAAAQGVPPSLYASIIAHETGGGTSRTLIEGFNPAGVKALPGQPKLPGTPSRQYENMEEGLRKAAVTVGNRYREAGGDIAKMGGVYAPLSDSPLNKYWIPKVTENRQLLAEAGVPLAPPGPRRDQPPVAPTQYAGPGGAAAPSPEQTVDPTTGAATGPPGTRAAPGPQSALPPPSAPTGAPRATGATGPSVSYLGGTITVGGETFRYGSGPADRGALPPGTFPININDPKMGPRGKAPWGTPTPKGPGLESIATVGGPGGVIQDPRYREPRTQIQIHRARTMDEKLQKYYTAGCVGIAPQDWPRFKAALLREDARIRAAGGTGLDLNVDKNGQLTVQGRNVAPPVTPPTAVAGPAAAAAPPPGPVIDPRTGAPVEPGAAKPPEAAAPLGPPGFRGGRAAAEEAVGGGRTLAPTTTEPTTIDPRTGRGAASEVSPDIDAARKVRAELSQPIRVPLDLGAETQFGRASFVREASNATRNERWNANADIGTA